MSVKIAERLERVRPYGERRIALGPGVVWIFNPDLGTGLCFPIQKLGYRVRLTGPAAAVEAFLTFVNPTAEPQKAYFLFPLDRNIAPVKIQGKFGDTQLETDVAPAPVDPSEQEAEATLPPELCKIFRNETEKVIAIPLGEIAGNGQVTFKILFAQMVYECSESGLGFSYRQPLLVSQALNTLQTEDRDHLTLAKGLERGAQIAFSLQIEASDLQPGQVATSQVCGVARNQKGDLTVEYDRRKPLESRDFVVDYQLWTGNKPKAWLRSQGRHFLLNFLPPGTPPPSAPRRLVFLVDGSEEMEKVGPQRCFDCLRSILSGLAAEDRFALVTFSREVSGYENGDFVQASLAEEALQWIEQYQFSGGADLKELLRRVITLPRQPDSVLSVVLVAAGRIGNEPELYRLLQGSRDILRLFPIQLGSKADPHFARAAARLTGGHAFRALNSESVSRVAERVLEHTRQPVLEGVGFQDKGLQYQAESLTPKYPSGLNWRRPITVMGAHTGRGGLEAGGNGPGGTSWSEFLELKPAFHKVLANVWAHVKATELDDEAQMLNRAERSLLQKVILNLSREFKLLNRHTTVAIRTSTGQQMLSPPLDPYRWYKKIEAEAYQGKSATELLEEQRSMKPTKGGISTKRDPGHGLRLKESLGAKDTAAVYGSKLGPMNKLAGNVKEGIFSKPIMGAGAVPMADTATGKPLFRGRLSGSSTPPVAGTNNSHPKPTPRPEPAKPQPVESELPEPESDFEELGAPEVEQDSPPSMPRKPHIGATDPGPEPEPTLPEAEDKPDDIVADTPTQKLSLPSIPVISKPVDDEPEEEEELDLPDLQTQNLQRPDVGGEEPREGLPEDVEELEGRPPDTFRPPVIGAVPRNLQRGSSAVGLETEVRRQAPPEPAPPEPETVSPEPEPEHVEASSSPAEHLDDPSGLFEPPEVEEEKKPELPTPRELAQKVTAQARQGKPEEVARNALRQQPQTRQSLMAEMRLLHSSLAETQDMDKLAELTDAVLFRLAEVAPNSELLVRAYGLGFQARGMLSADSDEAKKKLKFWLTRFAKLF